MPMPMPMPMPPPYTVEYASLGPVRSVRRRLVSSRRSPEFLLPRVIPKRTLCDVT
ncbi:expressed unknown protein [Ectocarpus siliculosus]|uniref:Uncharacterized protein n=1 Tax=Ectocarpus siliculosus TaxID=2880 RepID=D8LG91_ECTSI|nr:expressed unknown protein [Ectocarpus siliculosus]|eukprot:CBN78990.1 expressed unknown protein [Ectocarpus siliculosus]